jgi:DNA-binding XRE family transcriptional regulator
MLSITGMTQQELADIALNGNAAHLSRIMNGQRRCISLPIAFKIADALNKPVEEVFIKTITQKPNETKLN